MLFLESKKNHIKKKLQRCKVPASQKHVLVNGFQVRLLMIDKVYSHSGPSDTLTCTKLVQLLPHQFRSLDLKEESTQSGPSAGHLNEGSTQSVEYELFFFGGEKSF